MASLVSFFSVVFFSTFFSAFFSAAEAPALLSTALTIFCSSIRKARMILMIGSGG